MANADMQAQSQAEPGALRGCVQAGAMSGPLSTDILNACFKAANATSRVSAQNADFKKVYEAMKRVFRNDGSCGRRTDRVAPTISTGWSTQTKLALIAAAEN